MLYAAALSAGKLPSPQVAAQDFLQTGIGDLQRRRITDGD